MDLADRALTAAACVSGIEGQLADMRAAWASLGCRDEGGPDSDKPDATSTLLRFSSQMRPFVDRISVLETVSSQIETSLLEVSHCSTATKVAQLINELYPFHVDHHCVVGSRVISP